MSSTHAEMRALFTLVLDIIFTVHLCEEIGRPIALPAIVFEDNQPVIDLMKTLGGKITRSKHFLMLIEFIREQVVSGLIELKKISSDENVADVLTKLLFGRDFTTKASYLLGEMGLKVEDLADLSSWMEEQIDLQPHQPNGGVLDILLYSSTMMSIRSFIGRECKLDEVIGRYENRYVNRIIEFYSS